MQKGIWAAPWLRDGPKSKTFAVSQVERFPDMGQTTLLQFG